MHYHSVRVIRQFSSQTLSSHTLLHINVPESNPLQCSPQVLSSTDNLNETMNIEYSLLLLDQSTY